MGRSGSTLLKAITLLQPWASLVAMGAKTIETRPYATQYRGPLAIHAAKTATFVRMTPISGGD